MRMTGEDILLLVLIPTVMFFLAFIIFSWLYLGTVLGFELTPEQIDDEQKTQFCIVYNISNEECFLVYGDTQSNWEPKK